MMPLNDFKNPELIPITNVIGLASQKPLVTFPEMWYQTFLWALFSSTVVHAVAAIIAFATLHKHNFGKFFPLFILLVGIFAPLSSGIVSSAIIAFVYRASSIQMQPLYAMFWGVGQTLLSAAVGFTRILATL
ncbi:transmembrane protein 170A [Daktulosphaira vitifoliae]|uniref:transmembrane protein 170A n=1 Tax=Daktulosphaira vitifoliae TaxID=58002 RepID=UPI0021AAA1F9|nr:transmembrane protein 170A [Daktulosphaira vitifoliae]